MAYSYNVQVTGGLMDGNTLVRSLPAVIADATGYDFEDYWHSFEVAGGGSQVIPIDILDNARVIIVYGGAGITVVFDADGTDAIPADPFLVVTNETSGSGFDQITVANSGSTEQQVTVIAFAFKS